MSNVTVYDNGSAFCVCVDGLIVSAHSTLGDAWRHIAWMYRVASQKFTVGPNQTPSKEWLASAVEKGWLERNAGFDYV